MRQTDHCQSYKTENPLQWVRVNENTMVMIYVGTLLERFDLSLSLPGLIQSAELQKDPAVVRFTYRIKSHINLNLTDTDPRWSSALELSLSIIKVTGPEY